MKEEVEKEKKHKKKGKKGQEQIKESQREDEMKKSIQRSTKSLKFVLFNKQTICFSSLMLLVISGSKKLLQFP